MTQKVIDREQAKSLGLKHFFTGEPCKKGHLKNRLVSNSTCVECVRIYGHKYRSQAHGISKIKAWKENNKDKIKHYTAYWLANNLEKKRADRREWYRKNYRRIYEKNKQFFAEKRAVKRAREVRARPAWADKKIIRDFYQEAKYQQMHVDHIIPLKHPMVCGLHVEHNLQLLSPVENLKKGNKFPCHEY